VLDAHRPVTLHRLTLTTPTPGFTAEIHAGDSPSGPFPVTVSGSQQVQGPGTPFAIHSSAQNRYWVVWVTRLGDGFQSARIAGVTAN
jgi:hypothetical protein